MSRMGSPKEGKGHGDEHATAKQSRDRSYAVNTGDLLRNDKGSGEERRGTPNETPMSLKESDGA